MSKKQRQKLYVRRMDDGEILVFDGINTDGPLGYLEEDSVRACLNPDDANDNEDTDDTDDPMQDELKQAVKKRMTDKNLSYAEALREVTQQRPQLWERHKAAIVGGN